MKRPTHLNIRLYLIQGVCWLTGDAAAASTCCCSKNVDISMIPGCYIKSPAVSHWIGQEVSGGPVQCACERPSHAGSWKCMHAQQMHKHTRQPSGSETWIHFLDVKQTDRLERPEQTVRRRVSPACLHVTRTSINYIYHDSPYWNMHCIIFLQQ